MREQVLQYVDQYKIIAIVRGADPKQCFAVAEALYAGGIRLMEVTYDQKKPETWNLTLPMDRIRKFFPRSFTPQQMENTILKLLEAWQKKRQRQNEH